MISCLWKTRGPMSGRGRKALLPFWALFWVKNPFCNRDFWKSPFSMQEMPVLPCFEASWPFNWTIYQFHTHLSWDFCQKSYQQSVFCEIFGATRQFSNSPNLFHQFSASLAQKFKQNSGALVLGMAQTSLDLLLLPIFLYYLAVKVFFHAENSFICCFYSPVLRLKSPFSEKYFGPFALFWKHQMFDSALGVLYN